MKDLEQYGVRPTSLDVTDEQACKEAVAQIVKEQGRIDALTNNAVTTPRVEHPTAHRDAPAAPRIGYPAPPQMLRWGAMIRVVYGTSRRPTWSRPTNSRTRGSMSVAVCTPQS